MKKLLLLATQNCSLLRLSGPKLDFEPFLQVLLGLVFKHHYCRLRIRRFPLLPRRDCNRCESAGNSIARRLLSFFHTVEQKLVERLPVSEHHLSSLNPDNNSVSTACSACQTLVTCNLQTAFRAPYVLVPSGDEDGLPYSQVLLRAAGLPVCNSQSDGFKCPGCFLSPLREMFDFSFATLVEISSVTLLSEGGRRRFVAMDYSRTRATIDHFPAR